MKKLEKSIDRRNQMFGMVADVCCGLEQPTPRGSIRTCCAVPSNALCCAW